MVRLNSLLDKLKKIMKMISVIVFWTSVLISSNLFPQELTANQKNSQTASATFSMY